MKEVESLFFELLRVAIGTQNCLSRCPSQKEWKALYDMAKKQSLVGVCFAGLKRLEADADQRLKRIGMSETLYLTWLGISAKIQQRNELVNKLCLELQTKFSKDGFRSCILKGQGIAILYEKHLHGLRQSGDIDIYVDCGRKKALQYLRSIGIIGFDWDFVHTRPNFSEEIEVELHYRVSVFRNLWTNYRLQKFFERQKDEFFRGKANLPEGCLVVPSNWMNLFYLLHHAYRHLFSEGLGLRQVMDLYFAFKMLSLDSDETTHLKKAVKDFGMAQFASGMMWVLGHVFGLSIIGVPWTPNKLEGEFLLDEIMQSGNMGKMDSRYQNESGSKAGKLSVVFRRTLHLTSHYTSEALSVPIYYAWHFMWKRFALLKDKFSDK